MKFRKEWLYYVTGTIVFFVLWGLNVGYCLFILIGFGLGVVLHSWIMGMYNDTVNAFYTNESRKRSIRQKELEQELEKYKEGD